MYTSHKTGSEKHNGHYNTMINNNITLEDLFG